MSQDNTRVFIGNVYYVLNIQDLIEIFSKAGNIIKLDLFTDEQGKSRGCGIIQYSSRASALRAISMFHNFELYSRFITVKEDETFYSQQKPTQIKLKGMPGTVTWQQLKDVCREMGDVLRADVKILKNGTANGTVLFDTEDQAATAVQLLNGAFFNGLKIEAFCEIVN